MVTCLAMAAKRADRSTVGDTTTTLRLSSSELAALDIAAARASKARGRKLTRNELILTAALRATAALGVPVEDPRLFQIPFPFTAATPTAAGSVLAVPTVISGPAVSVTRTVRLASHQLAAIDIAAARAGITRNDLVLDAAMAAAATYGVRVDGPGVALATPEATPTPAPPSAVVEVLTRRSRANRAGGDPQAARLVRSRQ